MAGRTRKIAINTGGGDAPGLNAVLRSATLAALERGWEIWGIRQGYKGLLDRAPDGLVRLERDTVRGIAHLGGTVLGTANRGDPFRFPTCVPGQMQPMPVDRSAELVARFRELGFDALIAVGGDGSMRIARELLRCGLPVVVGVPKTIDNDVWGTDVTFGFDTAVAIAAEALDRLHTTAEAHERVMVVEVMGRHAGWIALHAGIAGGADVLLLPEIPFRYEALVEKIRQREARGRHFSMVVVAEGAAPAGGEIVVKSSGDAFRGAVVLGGIGEHVAAELAARTGKEARALVLGHLQRGGSPTTCDRLLATRLGAASIRYLAEDCPSGMVAVVNGHVTLVPLDVVTSRIKTVDPACDTVRAAREMGLCFGDEPPGRFGEVGPALPLMPCP